MVINTRNKEVAKWSTPHTYRFREKKNYKNCTWYIIYILQSKLHIYIYIYAFYIENK